MTLAVVNERKAMLVGQTMKTSAQKKVFYISGITESGITIRPHSSNRDHLIRWAEVELMSENWEALKAGRITRSELATGNPPIFNTSYLASIFSAIEH